MLISLTGIIKGKKDILYEITNAGLKLRILTFITAGNLKKIRKNNYLTEAVSFIYNSKSPFCNDSDVR